MKKQTITAIGYDLSTTALSLVGRTNDGEEAFVSIPMRGATTWKNQPAFNLGCLPGLFIESMAGIAAKGFEFTRDGVISGSVRQHDMALLDAQGRLLMPALSWQCNAATEEVARLKRQGAETIVGRLEPRLILPKLLWALSQDQGLASKIKTVMTTGDFIAMQISGAQTLSSSEALSNGLLVQKTREFAHEFIDSVPDLNSGWFPPVVKSGRVIDWNPNADYRLPDWNPVRNYLPGWRVVAGLGDNHAGAVGSGLTDRQTVVISAGTSGTVTRAVKLGTAAAETFMQFEYYDDTLLLMMMADCASWYDRFVALFVYGKSHLQLDALALASSDVYKHPYPATPNAPFEDWFLHLPLSVQAKTMQYSIACHLADHFKGIFEAVKNDNNHSIRQVVLTGGLTRSPYFCQTLKAKILEAGFKGEIRVSSRVGPLANQAATLGALINALVGGELYPNLETAIKKLCPSRAI